MYIFLWDEIMVNISKPTIKNIIVKNEYAKNA